MHPLTTGAHVRFDGRRPALSGITDRRPDHRHGDALPAVAAPHRDAGNHPDGDVVDGWCRARVCDGRVVVPRTERHEPDRLRTQVRHQTC